MVIYTCALLPIDMSVNALFVISIYFIIIYKDMARENYLYVSFSVFWERIGSMDKIYWILNNRVS